MNYLCPLSSSSLRTDSLGCSSCSPFTYPSILTVSWSIHAHPRLILTFLVSLVGWSFIFKFTALLLLVPTRRRNVFIIIFKQLAWAERHDARVQQGLKFDLGKSRFDRPIDSVSIFHEIHFSIYSLISLVRLDTLWECSRWLLQRVLFWSHHGGKPTRETLDSRRPLKAPVCVTRQRKDHRLNSIIHQDR